MERPADRPSAAPASFEAQWRERFREFAESRDDEAGIAGWSPSGLDARLRRFEGLWNTRRQPGFWLDAGCGAGTYARRLAGEGHRVIGVDYSLVTVRKAVARTGGAFPFVVADVRRLPFPPETFDGVLCFGVVQALAESEPALRELAAGVKAGGELWIDALNRRCVINAAAMLRRRVAGRPMHLRYESARNIERILRRLDFDDVAVHWMPIVPANWAALQRWLERPGVQRILARVPLAGTLISHAFIVRARRPGAGPRSAPPA